MGPVGLEPTTRGLKGAWVSCQRVPIVPSRTSICRSPPSWVSGCVRRCRAGVGHPFPSPSHHDSSRRTDNAPTTPGGVPRAWAPDLARSRILTGSRSSAVLVAAAPGRALSCADVVFGTHRRLVPPLPTSRRRCGGSWSVLGDTRGDVRDFRHAGDGVLVRSGGAQHWGLGGCC